MTRIEFLSAAAKGQGRAISALLSGDVRLSLHDLRRLVLRWPGFDWQCESSRGWYTAELIKASAYEEGLTDLVIRHLARTKGPRRHRGHREAIVLELAKRGSSSARDALYANFDPAAEFRLGYEIVELDGLAGLDWVISYAAGCLTQEDAWQFEWWVEDLKEAFGEDTVSNWLTRESAARPEVAEFVRLVNQKPKRIKKPKQEAITFDSLRELARGPGFRMGSAVLWVQKTSDAELEKAWRSFETEKDHDWLRILARGLRRKPGHCDLDKVVDRARAWNAERNPFAWALEDVADPRVRHLAFDLIHDGWTVDGIALLSKNVKPGDEPAILEAAGSLSDEWDFHCVGSDLLDLGKELLASSLLVWVYEHTPCSFCREYAVRELIEQNQAPKDLLIECLTDCVKDTRNLAETALNSN